MKYPFNLTHLKFFYDSVRLGSVSEAAHHNYVSQSAISQGIKKLELALGMQLTQHLRHSFQLNSKGALLFEEAKNVFQVLDEMMDRLHRKKGEIKGNLRLVCPNSIALHLLPSVLKGIYETHPDLNVEFHRGSRAFIRNSLGEGSSDFALVLSGDEFSRYEKRVISRGRFGLYRSPDCKDRLENGIWVDFAGSREYKGINQKKKSLKIRGELSGWTMVASFINKGMGIGLIPDFMAEKDWVSHKCPKVEYEIWAIWPKGKQLLSPAIAFLNFCDLI